ncbi:MAG TPA: ThuA domain-containing protein [Solirubrobacteraceae bacterium]|nr:ThuA domain-containing protein [Solirubrobacteraceae bacterium]
MSTALILSGGPNHDCAGTSAQLVEILVGVGVGARVREDIEGALAELGERDLLVVNLLRWRMLQERYVELAPTYAISLSESARTRIERFVRDGGSLLAIHGAAICFDDWPGWGELIGARWEWGRSMHPPLGPVAVEVARSAHPIVAGLSERFTVEDEVYSYLDRAADVEALMSAEHGGERHPLLWAREVDGGRVVYDLLGHHVGSYDPPTHRRIVARAALWALRRPDAEIAAVSP